MYSDYESSLDEGTPVELYELVQGSTTWHYCSADVDIVFAARTYLGLSLKRDRIKQTSDVFKESLKLTFPRGNEFAAQYLGFTPEQVTTLTIHRGHFGDPDEEFIVYWKGRVIGAKASENTVTVEFESIFTSIRRPGLRAKFEYTCRHTLYQTGCEVQREAYKYENVVTDIVSGLQVTVTGASGQADGYYTGGMVLLASGTTRFIVNHVGDVITLARPIFELETGATIKLYPGCDHLKSTCQNKFNNLLNFGGFPYIPQRNPFDGSSIV